MGEEGQEGGTVCGNFSTRDRFPGGWYWGRYTSVIMWPGNESKEENKQKCINILKALIPGTQQSRSGTVLAHRLLFIQLEG